MPPTKRDIGRLRHTLSGRPSHRSSVPARGCNLYLSLSATKPFIILCLLTHSICCTRHDYSIEQHSLFKNMNTFRDNECFLLKESPSNYYNILCSSFSLSLSITHTLYIWVRGLRSDSCRVDFRGRARSPSKSKYKRRAAAGRRRVSHKSARLINTTLCDGESCLFARYRRCCRVSVSIR